MFKFKEKPEKRKNNYDPLYEKLQRMGFRNPTINMRYEVLTLDVPQVYNDSGTVYQDLLKQGSKLAIYPDKKMVLFNANKSMEMDIRTLNLFESRNVFGMDDPIGIENFLDEGKDTKLPSLFSDKDTKEKDIITAFFDNSNNSFTKLKIVKNSVDKIIDTVFDARNNFTYHVNNGEKEVVDNIRIDFNYKSFIVKGAILKLDLSGFPALIHIRVDGRTVIEEHDKSIDYGSFTFQQLQAMSMLEYDAHLRNEATNVLESLAFQNFESMMSTIDIIPTRYPLTKDSCGHRVLEKLISKYY